MSKYMYNDVAQQLTGDGREGTTSNIAQSPIRKYCVNDNNLPQVACVPSSLKCYALRLSPGEEIKSRLLAFVKFHNLQAAFILTCVGSVQKAKIRLANATATNTNDVCH